MRLTRNPHNEANPRSCRFKAAVRVIAAVPLAAGIIGSAACSEAGLPDDCRSFNGTTITLNSETDGHAADLRSIESLPEGSFLTPFLTDFINEAHVISTEGIPPRTKATQAPAYCLVRNGERAKSAYVQAREEDGRDVGVYVPENPYMDPVTLLNLISHEIGHLQPGNPVGGSEALSQLNEYEQKIAGLAVLLEGGADRAQLVRWAFHESRTGLFYKLAGAIGAGRGLPGNDPLDRYDLANMFLLLRLGEYGGDIAAVRSEFRRLAEAGALQAELESASVSFLRSYGPDNLADLSLEASRLLSIAAQRHYGIGLGYADAHSGSWGQGLVSGLEGMLCAPAEPAASGSFSPCGAGGCAIPEADISRPVSYTLCCISAEEAPGGLSFRAWSVDAAGTEYARNGGRLVIDGFAYDSATELSATRSLLPEGSGCD